MSDTSAPVHITQVVVEREPYGDCELNWVIHNSPVMNCALPFPKPKSAAEVLEGVVGVECRAPKAGALAQEVCRVVPG
jgi:hypothetical protein